MAYKKGPTIKDVAALAGVSVMSVSRVCDPQYTGRVSPEMREKIRAAIDTLGYRPDYVARSLRNGRTDTVGFYNGYRGLMLLSDDFPRSIFMGLQDELTTHRKDLLVYNVPNYPRSPVDVVRQISLSKVDGIVFLPQEGDEELSRLLGESHQNVVAIVEAVPGLPAVTAQDVDGSRRLARHLYDRGHRHVLYRTSKSNLTSARRRYDAFVNAADALSMRITSTKTTATYDDLDEYERSLICGSRTNGITAVVGWHDHSAVVALNFCVERGMSIPDDIAVAGFDNLTPPDCPPGIRLTTVGANWYEVARRGVTFVVDGKRAAVHADLGDQLTERDGGVEISIDCPLIIGNTT